MQAELKFRFEKETKGAVQYKEVHDGESYIIGTLYVRKAAMPTPYPHELTVTVKDTL